MRKVSIVWSSPNPDGLTASSKNQFVRGLEGSGVEVAEIHYRSGILSKDGICL